MRAIGAGATYADYLGKLAKEVYSKARIENLQNMEAKTFSALKKYPTKPDGDGCFSAILPQGNQSGQGSQNELEALRTPDYQHVEKWRVRPKILTHTVQVSGLSLETMEGNEESFADNFTLQMDEGLKDAAKEENQQCYRDGSGLIARCNGASVASTTVTFDTGVPTHFRIGTPVDIFDNVDTVKQVNGVKITDVDISGKTITLASAVSCDDNGYIYRKSVNDNAPTDGKEMAGFPRITDDGTDFASYQNVPRTGASAIALWDGQEIAAGGANLSDDFLQRLRARMIVKHGKTPNRICSNTSQKRQYLSLTLPSIIWNEGQKRDTGVGSGMGDKEKMPAWDGIPWMVDTDCGFDEVYMYNDNYVFRFETRALSFDNRFSGNILKWNSGFDSGIAYAKAYENIGTNNPGGMIRATGLAEPTY